MSFNGPAQRKTGVYCQEHWNTVGYPLLSTEINYTVTGHLVDCVFVQKYKVVSAVDRDVAYIFEIPAKAAVTGFSAQVGGRTINAVVKEKQEAKRVYDSAVAAGNQAWRLDQLSIEVFQVMLGNAKPNDSIVIRVSFVQVIASDSLEDTIRLTIPNTFNQAGAAPWTNPNPTDKGGNTTTAPKSAEADAVSITVSIDMPRNVLDVSSPTHDLAPVIYGFSSPPDPNLSPRDKDKLFRRNRAYAYYRSPSFLQTNFVLVITCVTMDAPYCFCEQYKPATSSTEAPTYAFALTMVSGLYTPPPTGYSDYIFICDYSGSMQWLALRLQIQAKALAKMLDSLRTVQSTFNIYIKDNKGATSIFPGGKSIIYNETNAADALKKLPSPASVNTSSTSDNLSVDLNFVFSQRDRSAVRTNVILLGDGGDWNEAAVISSVNKAVQGSATSGNLLRVFVLAIGNIVNEGLCEAIARVGLGTVTYISESRYEDVDAKAAVLIQNADLMPARVVNIAWPIDAPDESSADGDVGLGGGRARKPFDTSGLGGGSKADTIPPPPPIQQAPEQSELFWAARSDWYAIVRGQLNSPTVVITYEILDPSQRGVKTARVTVAASRGATVHRLAAHALIQKFEDRAKDLENDSTKNYWNEAEIVRLGLKYTLASTQTSFIATSNGVEMPAVSSFVSPSNKLGASFDLPGTPSPQGNTISPQGFAPPGGSAPLTINRVMMSNFHRVDVNAAFETLSDAKKLVVSQDSVGSFPEDVVKSIVFPLSEIPAQPAELTALHAGPESLKSQIWITLLAVAFLQKNCSDEEEEWKNAQDKAIHFAEMNLSCCFGVAPEAASRMVQVIVLEGQMDI